MKNPTLTIHRIAALLVLATVAGPALPAQESLDALVTGGLRASLTRRQAELSLSRADAQVSEARGRFVPSATLNARYTEVSGSSVDLGAIVNPAFAALNQLLQKPQFPTDLNLRLPQKQETTLRLAQPLFQPALCAAYGIATNLRDAQAAQRDAVTRALALDMRSAYLNWAKARSVVEIYAATVPLVEENLRIAERLVEAGKATPDVIFRARAERSDVLQKRDEAIRQAATAREYLNLVLERPLDAQLPLFADAALGIDSLPSLESALDHGRSGREELRQLASARGATQAQRRLAQAAFLPAVSVALDYGIQGDRYRFNRDADFTQTSLVLSWNLFNGAQDASRVEQATLDSRRLEAQAASADRQVALEVRSAWAAARVARDAIATADDRVAAARRTWDLTRRRYEQGMAPQMELLDARTSLTGAELNRVMTAYDYFLRRVELDRSAALYPRTMP